jgi:hypothetical protein
MGRRRRIGYDVRLFLCEINQWMGDALRLTSWCITYVTDVTAPILNDQDMAYEICTAIR